MEILITGGGGYIGSILVPYLLEANYKVTVIDNFMYNQTSLLDYCYHENLQIIRGDCRDSRLLTSLMVNADLIIPLACLVGAPICQFNPVGARTINFDAVKMIIDNKSRDQMVIFPSTNSGYGIGQAGIHCSEDTALNPISLYGKLKVDIEQIVLEANNSITLRLATVFGVSPRMRLDLLVNDFVYKASVDRSIVLFEPHFKRNFIHIRDVARAFAHCIDNFTKMKGLPYNVGLSDANLSKIELCEEIKKFIPSFEIYISDNGQDQDKRNYIVSNERIEKTGYLPKYNLDFGINELIKGYNVFSKVKYGNI